MSSSELEVGVSISFVTSKIQGQNDFPIKNPNDVQNSIQIRKRLDK